LNSFTIKFLRSREYCWAIGAILFIGLPVAAFYWFNYYRIGDFEMRWTTGEQAGFRSRGPDFDPYGNPKVLILWPGPRLHCYQSSYSKDLFTYLRKENKSTVRITLQLRYSYGSIYGATLLRVGNYHLRDELSELRQDANGNCMEHLENMPNRPGWASAGSVATPFRYIDGK
jgi:hypothetical protein